MIFKHPELACTACSMRSYFTTYDADKNGMLDKQELRCVHTTIAQ